MPKKHLIWKPNYSITSAIARSLMEIESARTVVENTLLTPVAALELRNKVRVRSTHYSTRIEGNKLTLKQTEQVIRRKRIKFHGRERDISEVRNYWNALLRVEDWAARKAPLTESLIRRLHALVEMGVRAKPTPYRTAQNAVRDSAGNAIVYLPPAAKDVPKLMSELAGWVGYAERSKLPAPIIAGLLHYQFVTIHPYYDGNGRTARLLATFILQRDGYGLNGFFSPEEHHARELEGYYNALTVDSGHNYYEGRNKADLTPWMEYFIVLLSKVFNEAKEETLLYAKKRISAEPRELRKLDHRARTIFSLFIKKEYIAGRDVSETLGLSARMSRVLMNRWVKDGWLMAANTSNRARAYGLSAIYRQYITGLSAMPLK